VPFIRKDSSDAFRHRVNHFVFNLRRPIFAPPLFNPTVIRNEPSAERPQDLHAGICPELRQRLSLGRLKLFDQVLAKNDPNHWFLRSTNICLKHDAAKVRVMFTWHCFNSNEERE
jgi:hypothetical protein